MSADGLDRVAIDRTTRGRTQIQTALHNFIEVHLDIRDVRGLAAIDIALAGRLGADLDRLRALGAVRLDIQVSGGPGGYFVLLHGLSEHGDVVVDSAFIGVEDDRLDDDALRALVALGLAGIVERGRRQQRQIELRRGR